MNEKIKLYLDYLDKEMSIMGILSTFCVAVPALILERVTTAEDNFLANAWDFGNLYFLIASTLMLIAAGLFYKERSRLAWYYGQIALKENLPDYTEPSMNQWLKDADSWATWIWYKSAFYILFIAILEYIFAFSSFYSQVIKQNVFTYGVIPLIVLLIFVMVMTKVNLTFKYEDKPFIAWLKREKRKKT